MQQHAEHNTPSERIGARLYRAGWHLGRLLTTIYGALVAGFARGVKSRLAERHQRAAD